MRSCNAKIWFLLSLLVFEEVTECFGQYSNCVESNAAGLVMLDTLASTGKPSVLSCRETERMEKRESVEV